MANPASPGRFAATRGPEASGGPCEPPSSVPSRRSRRERARHRRRPAEPFPRRETTTEVFPRLVTSRPTCCRRRVTSRPRCSRRRDEPTEVLAGAAVAADGTGEFTREHRRRVSHRRYVMRRIGVSVATWRSSAVACACSWRCSATTTTAPGHRLDDAGHQRAAVAADDDPGRRRRWHRRRPTLRHAHTAAETTEATPARPDDHCGRGDRTRGERSGAPTSTTATESSPPGTVVYDLDSEASCEIGQTLRRGDAGPQVAVPAGAAQRGHRRWRADPAVDGAFGEQTEAAVRAFQEANELGVDGIVGPATGELLGIWAG